MTSDNSKKDAREKKGPRAQSPGDLTSPRDGYKSPFDLSIIAQGMGVHGERITDPVEIGPALKRAFASGKPALLDVVIDGVV